MPALAVGLAVTAASIAPTPARACQCWEAPGPGALQGRMVQDLEGHSGPNRHDAGHSWSHGYEARGADCRPNEGRGAPYGLLPLPDDPLCAAPPCDAARPAIASRRDGSDGQRPLPAGNDPRLDAHDAVFHLRVYLLNRGRIRPNGSDLSIAKHGQKETQ